MEACGSAHHWGRLAAWHGHEVLLMNPQFVAPYVKSNKNDVNDADGIAEASTRPLMRFVGLKSVEQQHVQQVHRARQMAVRNRTAQCNQLHGLLLEYGIEAPRGVSAMRRRLPEVLEDAENELPVKARALLHELGEELRRLDERVQMFDEQVAGIAARMPACKRLMTVPGIGVLTATALVAAVGDPSKFRNGREMAAWLGLVPRQRSTGGRTTLLGISKRGDRYLRTLLIHGARSTLRFAPQRTGPAQLLGGGCRGAPGAQHCRGGVGQSKRANRVGFVVARVVVRCRLWAEGSVNGGKPKPGTSLPSPSQAATRLLRFATALRVTRCRQRRGGVPWPKGSFRPCRPGGEWTGCTGHARSLAC